MSTNKDCRCCSHCFQSLSIYPPNNDATLFSGSFSSASIGPWEKDPAGCSVMSCDFSTRVETIRIIFADLS